MADVTTGAVVEVDEATFEPAVLERSRKVPVVVDFWAPWCGPCRMLGPVLERLAEEGGGRWVLAKVNTDQNPALAGRYGVQGIPAVKAFRDGQVVDEFVGAQPEPTVRQFLDGLLPSEADMRTAEAQALEERGQLEAAEAAYREILTADGDSAAARLGLGRVLLAADRYDEARETLERVPAGSDAAAEAEQLAAQARFRAAAALTGGEIEARRRIAADPDDVEARLALVSAQAADGRHREALEGLLELLEHTSDPDMREQARALMLDVFSVLGDEHELTRTYRPRLASLLW